MAVPGKVLTRLFELRDEVRLFLINSKFPLTHYLNDFAWLSSLAYLADIFNIFNLSLQGTSITVFSVYVKYKKYFHFGFYGGRGELTFGTGGPRHQKGWETLV
jgi:hypothetical protein